VGSNDTKTRNGGAEVYGTNLDDREPAKKKGDMNIQKKDKITGDLRLRVPILADERSILALSGAVDPSSGMPSVQDRIAFVVHNLELRVPRARGRRMPRRLVLLLREHLK
jgi:hypothetical protein